MTRSAAARVAPALASLLASTFAANAFADDVSDELSAGAISSNVAKGSSPFVSDRLGGSIDTSDALSFSADATFTRYFHSPGASGESIFQLAGASDYSPDDHWAFGADVRGSPPSSTNAPDPVTSLRYKYTSSSLGGGLSAEYDTAGGTDFETIGDTYLGLTGYRTTQHPKDKAANGNAPAAPATSARTPPSLAQWRASLGITEQLWQSTEIGLNGTYYLYSQDPTDTGYGGESLFGRAGVGDGIPLEPLRWALRPTVRQRIGPVKASAYVQYGRYVGDSGFMVTVAIKAQLKLSEAFRLWAQVGFQRDADRTGETLSIPWGSVGARVML